MRAYLATSEAGNLILGHTFPPFGASNFFLGATFPYNSTQAAPPQIPSTVSLSDFLFAFNPALKLPYTLQWNFSLEQALGKDQVVTASYVGAAGRRLLQTSDILSPPTNPNLQGAAFVDNTASSDYHALQLKFQRRVSHGLQAVASYTWSHSIDTGSAGSTDVTSNAGIPGNRM